MTERVALGFGLRFEDLYRRDGLVRLDGCVRRVPEIAHAPRCTTG